MNRPIWALSALLCLSAIVSAKSAHRVERNTMKLPVWVVYDHPHFERNELCKVLSCRKHEVCLVRESNAMCMNKHKLHKLEGKKVHFRDFDAGELNKEFVVEKTHDGSKWDAYNEKLAQKQARREQQHPNEYRKPATHHQPPQSEKKHHTEQKTHHTEQKTHHTERKEHHAEPNRQPAARKEKVRPQEPHSNHESRHATTHHECTPQQFHAIGRRMVQWFTDVHRSGVSVARGPLKPHHVACREDIGWMFGQLDGNEDGELDVEELFSVEHDQYEPCIRPFLDRCDVKEVDNVLTIDEWCDCFQFSDAEDPLLCFRVEFRKTVQNTRSQMTDVPVNSKNIYIASEGVAVGSVYTCGCVAVDRVTDHLKEPECHKALRQADPHLLGAFRPRCDVDGFYKPAQCHERDCWCVDKWGREFDGSRVQGKRPDCGQYEEENDDEDLNMETEGSGKDEK